MSGSAVPRKRRRGPQPIRRRRPPAPPRQLVLFADALIGRPPMNISRRDDRHAIAPLFRGLRIANDLQHVAQRGEPGRSGVIHDIVGCTCPGLALALARDGAGGGGGLGAPRLRRSWRQHRSVMAAAAACPVASLHDAAQPRHHRGHGVIVAGQPSAGFACKRTDVLTHAIWPESVNNWRTWAA